MTLDFSTLPIDIYADLLEEQGLDVSKLRGFLDLGGVYGIGYGPAYGIGSSIDDHYSSSNYDPARSFHHDPSQNLRFGVCNDIFAEGDGYLGIGNGQGMTYMYVSSYIFGENSAGY